jgi:hypothetical protein
LELFRQCGIFVFVFHFVATFYIPFLSPFIIIFVYQELLFDINSMHVFMAESHSINFPALLLQKAVIDLFNIRLSALVDLYFSFYEIFV